MRKREGEKRKASPEGGERQAIRGKVFIEPSIYSQTCPHYRHGKNPISSTEGKTQGNTHTVQRQGVGARDKHGRNTGHKERSLGEGEERSGKTGKTGR